MRKISVIIPCFNAELYIRQCVDSVLNQTMNDIEIICVDDGSTDNTVSILNEYAQRDCRVKVLCQKNEFAGIARNKGMEIATGEYLAFLDADDYYACDGLEKAYLVASANEVDVLKLSSYLHDNKTGEITTNAHYSHERFAPKNEIVKFADAPEKLSSLADVAWNGLYKRSFIEDNNIKFNNLRCVNDRSFFIKCILYAERVMVTDSYLTFYRRNLTDSLVSNRHKNFECQIASYKLISTICSDCGASLISDTHKRMLLQKELCQIFIWYEKFLNSGVNVFYVEEILRDFFSDFPISDVGSNYISTFPYRHYFYRFSESKTIKWQPTPSVAAPLISVIVPVYNSVKYLSSCIESVLAQTFTQFELICIDDGSADASFAILECLANKDSRIRLLRQDHKGAGSARNYAIEQAKGKYLAFLDSDDMLSQNFLESLFTQAESHCAEIVVTPRVNWDGRYSQITSKNWYADNKLPRDTTFSYRDIPDYILNFCDGAPGGKLFLRSFVQSHGLTYLEIRRSEDFYFVHGSIVRAEKIIYDCNGGYIYRKNNPSSLENTKDETPLMFWSASLAFKSSLQTLEYFDTIKRSFQNYILNKIHFNLFAVNTFCGFNEIFTKIKEIYDSELEMNLHCEDYFFEKTAYSEIIKLNKFNSAGDYLLARMKQERNEASTIRSQLSHAKQEIARAKQKGEMASTHIKQSATFRIGLAMTFVPRHIRGLVWCIRDHGLRYTIKHALKKIRRFLAG